MNSKNQIQKREIKFRGKRIDDGQWVYGSYHYSADGKYHYILSLEKFNLRRHENGVAGLDELCLFKTEVSEINPETVGQFIGLHDKNGKEIYESDILKLQYPLNYGFAGIHNKEIIVLISFETGCFWFTGDGYTDCNWHFYNEYEVIGNRFENPELLK